MSPRHRPAPRSGTIGASVRRGRASGSAKGSAAADAKARKKAGAPGASGRGGSSTRAHGTTGAASSAPSAGTSEAGSGQEVLRVGFIPGVEPDRFRRRWDSAPRPARLELVPIPLSRQLDALASGEVDMCFLRQGSTGDPSLMPGPAPDRRLADLHVVPLWEERPVAVLGSENVLSLHEELSMQDLAEETEIHQEGPDDAADRVAVVAAGVGFTRMPLSLARLHHRKDAVHRVILDAEPTRIAIAWPRESDDDLRQQFVGTVRGRTGRSSR